MRKMPASLFSSSDSSGGGPAANTTSCQHLNRHLKGEEENLVQIKQENQTRPPRYHHEKFLSKINRFGDIPVLARATIRATIRSVSTDSSSFNTMTNVKQPLIALASNSEVLEPIPGACIRRTKSKVRFTSLYNKIILDQSCWQCLGWTSITRVGSSVCRG